MTEYASNQHSNAKKTENDEEEKYKESKLTRSQIKPGLLDKDNSRSDTLGEAQVDYNKEKTVVEKVGEEPSTRMVKDFSAGDKSESSNDPDSVVRNWESDHHQVLPNNVRKLALLAASIHLGEGRGILVSDLEKLGLSKDNAERKLYISKTKGLLVPHDIRIGKQKQYFLSNYKYMIDSRAKIKKQHFDESLLNQDLILQLLIALSNRKYTYHHIHLETYLNYIKDYNLFKWDIPSSNNKQKVNAFKLESRRKCSITISTTGTINISIECTLDPYHFHTPSGIAEFFASCGQILSFLQAESRNVLNIVPPITKWFLIQFEYNKDLERDSEEVTILSWTPMNGKLVLEYLGTVFQIYPKLLPYVGDCTRFEAKFSTREKVKMIDMIGDIVSGTQPIKDGEAPSLPFVTAEELLKKAKDSIKPKGLG
jgi:hypothetical protein